MQGHALRAAINTPIQGSAADVATAAMLSIDACQELKELGWKMLLQVLCPSVEVPRMHALCICSHPSRCLHDTTHCAEMGGQDTPWVMCQNRDAMMKGSWLVSPRWRCPS